MMICALPEKRVASSFTFSAGVFVNAAIAGIASVAKNKIAKMISAFFIFLSSLTLMAKIMYNDLILKWFIITVFKSIVI